MELFTITGIIKWVQDISENFKIYHKVFSKFFLLFPKFGITGTESIEILTPNFVHVIQTD